MNRKVHYIPDGFHTLTVYLTVKGANEALAFYKQAFGAIELMRIDMPDGLVAHAEFKIGDSVFMLTDENPSCHSLSPLTLGGSPVTLYLYVPDVDAVFTSAISAGATERMPVGNQFWGDRTGVVVDPFGHNWHLATHIEEVDPNDLPGRMAAFFAAQQA